MKELWAAATYLGRKYRKKPTAILWEALMWYRDFLKKGEEELQQPVKKARKMK